MDPTRRLVMTSGLGAGALIATATASAGARDAAMPNPAAPPPMAARPGHDQTSELQQAIDRAAIERRPLLLGPGDFVVGRLELRPGSILIAVPGQTRLVFDPQTTASEASAIAGLYAAAASGILLDGLTLTGKRLLSKPNSPEALVDLRLCAGLVVRNCRIEDTPRDGLHLDRASGRVVDNTFNRIGRAALFSEDAAGLLIAHNTITDCADNGILVWRRSTSEDGTIVEANHIARIAAASGGSGQNGNGVNVFRAANVTVTANRISDCAYTAVRGNAASNLIVSANNCSRLGEVAIYAEFGFEGASITGNLIDSAASGISVTNFNDGGRLAIVTGNLIRNLHRREFEPVDKRGEGISVEADTMVANNIIEGAPTCAIRLGWGTYRRDVMACQNVIREAGYGILISAEKGQGQCAVTGNLISGAKHAAIRLDDHGHPLTGDLTKAPAPLPGLTISQNLVS